MKIRHYYHPKNHHDVFSVQVKSRRQQERCSHVWRERLWSEVKSKWGRVCKLCGMTGRGRI